jgi:CHAT domain-containing protein/Tfp pilus assembly protein PilF
LRKWLLFLIAGVVSGQDAATRLLTQTQADLAAGRYAAAIGEGNEAAALFHKAGDRAAEGRAMNSLGLAQLYSGEYAPALNSFTQALLCAVQLRDVSNEIVRLNNIGNVLYFQGHYAEALDRYQEAMRRVGTSPGEKWFAARRQLTMANTAILYQTLGQYERALELYTQLLQSRQALPIDEQAQLLANVGTLRRRLGDPVKALKTYREAQSLYGKAANKDAEIAVLNNIGIVQAIDLNAFDEAASTFSNALKLAEASGNRPMAVHARLYRGETYYRAGRLQDSLADFQKAESDADALGETEETWKALYGLGRISAKSGNVAECDQLLNRAVKLIESLRAGLKQSSLRSEFLADKRDVYDLLIEHTSQVDVMFRLMEQSRARNLQDKVRHQIVMPELQELQHALRDDTAVLEYWLGPSSAAVLWISKLGTGVRRWTMTPEQKQAVISLPSILADAARAEWRGAADVVAQQLLADLPPLQTGAIHNLVVIPDDILAQIPFEVLPLDTKQLVIERFSVSYLPSASLRAVAATSKAFRWPWQTTMVAFADPAPSASDANLESDRGWPRLPEARREVREIAEVLRGNSDVHAGSDARKKFLDQARKSSILHFATHAFADMNDPARSYILLAPGSVSQQFDHLYLREVESLPLEGVDLVTASACETDIGKLVRGEGVQSFSRAFLAAGARSAVTSLWAVGDRATADFMAGFYSNLADGQSKANALRGVKLNLLRQPDASHPAHWAAFVLNGESDTPIPYVISWIWIVLGTLLLVASPLAIFSWRARKA